MSKYYCPACHTETEIETDTGNYHCWFCEKTWIKENLLNEEELEKIERNFATVRWHAEDVLDLMPSWDIEKASKWLEENEKEIEEQIITEGWQILQNLLPEE